MSLSALISIIYGSISFGQLPTYKMMDLLLHPSYLAMYANLALAVCYFLLNDNGLEKGIKRLLWTAFIVLSITTFLTLSKTGILIWIVLIGGMFFYQLLVVKKQYKLSVVIALSGFAILYAAYQFIPRVKDRVEVAYSAIVKAEEEKVDVSTVESTQVRMLIWEQTTQIIKENTLFGVGTGDIKDELYVKYKGAGMLGALENKLNVHNQYLQVFATLGLLGMLLFVSSIIFPFITAYKQNNKYYLAFLVIFSINILFESMLEKQDGVIFYAFFNALLFFHFQPKISQRSSSRS
jgi:O-antigen ligase